MKSNEIRLGNIIGSKTAKYAIPYLTVFASDMVEMFSKDDWSNYFGIVLTEDWLIRFGFKKIGDYFKNGIFECHFGSFDVPSVYLEFDSTVTGSYSYDTGIKYVHELQNLYYVLTGEELVLSADSEV